MTAMSQNRGSQAASLANDTGILFLFLQLIPDFTVVINGLMHAEAFSGNTHKDWH